MKYYAMKEQTLRRQEIARKTVEYTASKFDGEGRWQGGTMNIAIREQLWFACAFLQEGSPDCVRVANGIIRNCLREYRFCHFSSFVCLQILAHFEDLLESDVKDCMDDYVLHYIDEFTTAELEFIGRNDNFPCMAVGTLTLGGQRYGRLELVEKAQEQMEMFMQQFDRRGMSAEYTSPTYTPIQQAVLAEIVNFAESEKIREMALRAEIRVWIDILIHMHWPTTQMAGPYSRGYVVDAMAGTHHARFAYYMLYGEEVCVNPMETVLGGEDVQKGTIAHHDADFLKISFMWQALPDSHCPVELAEWAKNRTYPYTCSGTAECASSVEYRIPSLPEPSSPLVAYYEAPERVNTCTTYMTEDYAMGVSRYSFLNGWMSQNLNVLFRKREVSGQKDVGNMFVRYVVNDHTLLSGQGEYFDMGSCFGMQRENTGVALYAPRILHDRQIKSLKLTINFSTLCGEPDEVWIGDRKLPYLTGCSGEDECIFVREGEVYFMLKPLNMTPLGRDIRCRISKQEKIFEISFYNYFGDAKDFDRKELLMHGNGVAVEVRSKREVGSFEAFRAMMKPKVTDRWFRMIREFCYENGDAELKCEYSPISRTARYVMIDGKLAEEPKMYSSQGIAGLKFITSD